MTESLSVDYRL